MTIDFLFSGDIIIYALVMEAGVNPVRARRRKHFKRGIVYFRRRKRKPLKKFEKVCSFMQVGKPAKDKWNVNFKIASAFLCSVKNKKFKEKKR